MNEAFSDDWYDIFYEDSYKGNSREIFEKIHGLLLDGSQPTDKWVNAESIPNFMIHFYRRVLDNIFIFICVTQIIRTLGSDRIITKSGIRMLLKCEIPDPTTPFVFDVFTT